MNLKKCVYKKTINNNMLYYINFFLEKFLCSCKTFKTLKKKSYFQVG